VKTEYFMSNECGGWGLVCHCFGESGCCHLQSFELGNCTVPAESCKASELSGFHNFNKEASV
jgi:hypothetical protein